MKLLKDERIALYAILGCGILLYFLANLYRVAIPGAMFDILQAELNCSAACVTGLGAAFMYVYALTQPAAGLAIERWGSKRVIFFGGFCFVCGALLFAGGKTPYVEYAARMLTGFGAGSIYLCLIRECMELFDRRYNIAISMVILVGYSGGIVANAPFQLAVDRFSFRAVLWGTAILTAAVWGIFALFFGKVPHPAVRKDTSLNPLSFGKVFRSAHNRAVYLFSSLNFGLYYVLQTVIGKKFLQDYCQVSPVAAGWVLSGMGALAAAAGFLFAFLSLHWNNRRRIFCVLAGYVSVAAFGTEFLLLLLNIRTGTVFIALFCITSFTASLSAIVIPLLKETNPEHLVGKSVSMLNSCFYLAVAGFGNLTGLLMNCFSPEKAPGSGVLIYGRDAYLSVFTLLFICSWAVLFFSLRTRETFGKNVAAQGAESDE